MLFTTQDGGQSWTSTAVPFDVTNAVFIDMNHAVSFNATDSMSVRRFGAQVMVSQRQEVESK
jgi:hypothetical protein